jgi:hypothetical protein
MTSGSFWRRCAAVAAAAHATEGIGVHDHEVGGKAVVRH